jgi:cell division protein FtsQ
MSSGRGSGAVRGRRPGAARSRGFALFSGRRRGRSQRPRRIRVRLPRPGPRVVVAIVAMLAVLGGAWLWVRQSSLVAVKRVSVAGASGPDATQIRSALIAAARDMTTLDVQMSHLRTAVSPYPVVKGLRVSTQFPHGMRIRVVEQVPVAMVQVDGRRTPVAGDGTLLRDVTTDARLPSIGLSVAPGGTRLTGIARSEVEMLAAAPYRLLARVQLASSDSTHGLVAQLRAGPRLYFGGASELGAKWDAVTEVLAAPSSAGAEYIDVTDPIRPAAGTGSDSGSTTQSGAATTGRSGGSTTAGTGTTVGG